MKSFALTLATWALLFALLWYGAHELFHPPGDWIGALVVSFFGALGIGSLRKARLERRDARIVAGTKSGPVDGRRTAVVGTLEPVDAVLTAPFSGKPCVLYDYEICHTPERSGDDRPSPVIDRGGMAMTPMFIRSGVREVRVLAFPGIEDFDDVELDDDAVQRAKAYVAATKFEAGSIVGAIKTLPKLLNDRSGSVRVDFRNTDYDDLDNSGFKERHVPVGARVCAIGLYSEKENAILPQDNVGGVRLISGTRQDALRSLRAGSSLSIVGAVFFLAVPGPIGYGVLTLRERYNEEHGLASVRRTRMEAFNNAVATGDAAGVRAAIARGIDVDAPLANGYPPLAAAGNTEIAKLLLEAGAQVDRPVDGHTPLMIHARDGRVDMVRLLIAHRADVKRQEPVAKMNALDIALANGQDAVATVLREAGVEEKAK